MSLHSRARPFTEHQCNGGFSTFPQWSPGPENLITVSIWTWTLWNWVKYFKIFTVRDKRQMKPIPFQSSWQKFSRNKSSVTLSFSDSENSEGIRWNPGKGNFIGHIILPPIKGPKNFPFRSQKFTQTVKSSMVPSKFAHNVQKTWMQSGSSLLVTFYRA